MTSDGDIRVLLAMDAVLSLTFSTAVVWGLSFFDLAALRPEASA